MKTKKILFSILGFLIVSMTLFTTCFFVVKKDNYNPSNFNIVAKWSGSGTAANPYRIASLSDLQTLQTNVNAGTNYSGIYFKQTANIDLSSIENWKPIGTNINYFAGVYDGSGYAISNVYVKQGGLIHTGFFGLISGESSKVMNVRLVDSTIINPNIESSIKMYTGGLVGMIINTTIENCSIENCDVSAASDNYKGYIGGLIGWIENACSISNCSSSGTVSGPGYVGGLIGCVYNFDDEDGGDITISHCYNKASVTGTGDGDCVGGITGGIYGTYMTECVNAGSVTGTGAFTGGLLGYMGTNSSAGMYSTVSNSYNKGTVKGNAYTGGLIGMQDWNCELLYCYNTGSVTGTGNYTGGLIGYANPYATTASDINENYNWSSYYCYNAGAITGTEYVGGLIGAITAGYSYIMDSFNVGNISGTGQYLGGLIGQYVNTTYTMIEDCYWDTDCSTYAYGSHPTNTTETWGYADLDTESYAKGGRAEWGLYRNHWDLFTWIYQSPENNQYPVLACFYDLYTGGEGTSYEPYKVKTADDLKQLAFNVNSGHEYQGMYIEQTADIDLSGMNWIPIGQYGLNYAKFHGNYDGGRYTISNLTISNDADKQGLFGHVSEGSITGVVLKNPTITSSEDYIGSVVGYSNKSPISYCDVTNPKILAGGSWIGGVAGYSSGAISYCNVSSGSIGKINESDLVSNVGGIVGAAISSAPISYSTNSATVSAWNYAGGIAGMSSSSITDCINAGSVTGTGEYAGGIVGSLQSFVSLTNCYNIAAVNGATYVGGVAGRTYGSSTSKFIKVESCFNSGTVNGSGSNVGGVVGYFYFYTNMENCYNSASVTATSNYAGGIVGNGCGSSSKPSTMTNCYNRGAVTATNAYAGGVAGRNYYIHISGCYNTASVTSTNNADTAGAVVGYGWTTADTYGVENTYYNSNLTTTVVAYKATSSALTNVSATGSSTIITDAKSTSWALYSTWDFVDTWGFLTGVNSDYPILLANLSTVTFDAGEGQIEEGSDWSGSGTTATKSVLYGLAYGTLPTPTRDEYKFLGWYTEDDVLVSSTSKVSIVGNHNLYAKWKYAYWYQIGAEASVSGFAGGDGSVKTPYHIATREQLAILAYWTKIGDSRLTAGYYFELTSGYWYYDMQEYLWTPIGSFDTPFTGTFIGNNTRIGNLNIKSLPNDSTRSVGFFGVADHADITGFYLSAATVTDTADDGATLYAGSVCGYANYSIINNVSCEGARMYCTSTSGQAGGIVGYANCSSITECMIFGGYVDCRGLTAIGGVVGFSNTSIFVDTAYYGEFSEDCDGYCGGIAGRLTRNSVLARSYFYAYDELNATAAAYAGGLAGQCSYSKIVSCFALSALTGTNTGSLVATLSGGTVLNCFGLSSVAYTQTASDNSHQTQAELLAALEAGLTFFDRFTEVEWNVVVSVSSFARGLDIFANCSGATWAQDPALNFMPVLWQVLAHRSYDRASFYGHVIYRISTEDSIRSSELGARLYSASDFSTVFIPHTVWSVGSRALDTVSVTGYSVFRWTIYTTGGGLVTYDVGTSFSATRAIYGSPVHNYALGTAYKTPVYQNTTIKIMYEDEFEGTTYVSGNPGVGVTIYYYKTDASVSSITYTAYSLASSTASATITYVKTGKSLRFVPASTDSWAYMGYSTSSSAPTNTGDSPTIAYSSTGTYYLFFRRISDNRLKYDDQFGYFYFEDGEMPQTAVSTYDTAFNTLLTNVADLTDSFESNGVTFYNHTYTYDSTSEDATFESYDGQRFLGLDMPTARTVKLKDPTASSLTYKSYTFAAGTIYWFRFDPIRWRVSNYGVSSTDLPSDWSSYAAGKQNFFVASDVLWWDIVNNDSENQIGFNTYASSTQIHEKIMSQTLLGGQSFDLGYVSESYSYNADCFVASSTSGNQKVQTTAYTNSKLSPVFANLEEIETYQGELNSYASALACVLAERNQDQFIEYWTRDFGQQLGCGTYVTESGTVLTNSYWDTQKGVRFTICMSEGSFVGV